MHRKRARHARVALRAEAPRGAPGAQAPRSGRAREVAVIVAGVPVRGVRGQVETNGLRSGLALDAAFTADEPLVDSARRNPGGQPLAQAESGSLRVCAGPFVGVGEPGVQLHAKLAVTGELADRRGTVDAGALLATAHAAPSQRRAGGESWQFSRHQTDAVVTLGVPADPQSPTRPDQVVAIGAAIRSRHHQPIHVRYLLSGSVLAARTAQQDEPRERPVPSSGEVYRNDALLPLRRRRHAAASANSSRLDAPRDLVLVLSTAQPSKKGGCSVLVQTSCSDPPEIDPPGA